MGLYVHCELPSKLGPVNDVEVFREREYRRCSLKIDLFFFSNFSFTRIGNKTDTRMFSDIKRVQMQM